MDEYSKKMRRRFAKKPIRTDRAGGKVVRHKAAKPTVLPSAPPSSPTSKVRLRNPTPKARPTPVRTPEGKPRKPRHVKPELVKQGDEQSHLGRAAPGKQTRLRGRSSPTKAAVSTMADEHLKKREDANVPNAIESVEHVLVEKPPETAEKPKSVRHKVTRQTVGSPSVHRREQFQFTEIPADDPVLSGGGGQEDEPSRGSNSAGEGEHGS